MALAPGVSACGSLILDWFCCSCSQTPYALYPSLGWQRAECKASWGVLLVPTSTGLPLCFRSSIRGQSAVLVPFGWSQGWLVQATSAGCGTQYVSAAEYSSGPVSSGSLPCFGPAARVTTGLDVLDMRDLADQLGLHQQPGSIGGYCVC